MSDADTNTDALHQDLLRGMLSSDRSKDGRGTFLLEVPQHGRTYIYNVTEDDGDLFYTPDPSNPDAPAIPPRSAKRPPPTVAEVLSLEEMPVPAPAPTKAPHKRRKGKAPPPPPTADAPPPDPDVTPLPFGPSPEDERRERLIARRNHRLRKAGVDPSLPPPDENIPLLPPPPKSNGRRNGAYGDRVECADGVERNVAECWMMLFQTNEIMPSAEKFSDAAIARRIAELFPTRAGRSRNLAHVTKHRSRYNRGALKCQPTPPTPPSIRSRRYSDPDPVLKRTLVLSSRGRAVAYLDFTDPPETPPRPMLHQPFRKAYERFFAEWKEERGVRAAIPVAARREARRLLLEGLLATRGPDL